MNLRQPQSSYGFSMVEVLVALVVLSVGMLGIAGLYVITLRSGSGAISRLQAVNLATDIGDRIRANRFAQAAYDTSVTVPADNGCIGGIAVNCTRAQIASQDIWDWNQQIQTALPGATGTIVVVPGALNNAQGMVDPSQYTITISWPEPDQTGGPSTHILVLQI